MRAIPLPLAELGADSLASPRELSDSRTTDVITSFRDVLAAIEHPPSNDEPAPSDASEREEHFEGVSSRESDSAIDSDMPEMSVEESDAQDAPILFSPTAKNSTAEVATETPDDGDDANDGQAKMVRPSPRESIGDQETASIETGDVTDSESLSSISTDESEAHLSDHPADGTEQRESRISDAPRGAEGPIEAREHASAAREPASVTREPAPPRAAVTSADGLANMDGDSLQHSEPESSAHQNRQAQSAEASADVPEDIVVVSARRGTSLAHDAARDASADAKSESDVEGEVSIRQADNSADASADDRQERSLSSAPAPDSEHSVESSADMRGDPVFVVDGSEGGDASDNGTSNAEPSDITDASKSSTMHLDTRSPERTDAPRTAHQRGPVSTAWLKTLIDSGIRFNTTDDGWNTLTLRLGEQDGTMTVDARREDDHVKLHVAFSDPALRATAAQQIDQLEEALRSHYDMAVDLSLGDNNPSGNRERPDGHRPSTIRPLQPEAHRHFTAASAPALAMGSTHEWIG